mgnify:CR=1 FL=1
MKNFILFAILVASWKISLQAAVAPETILPVNTFAVATVPDLNKARQLFKADPLVRMWNDPAMVAFTRKIEKAFSENVMQRIRKEAPIQPGEIWKLAQGQVTVALTRKPGQPSPGVILLVDSGSKAAELDREVDERGERAVCELLDAALLHDHEDADEDEAARHLH